MKQPLDIYDDMPHEMRAYLSNYGWHFNEKAAKLAVSLMRRRNSTTGGLEPIKAWDAAMVDDLLNNNGIRLLHNTLHDYIYVANMAVADYYGSSITDHAHLALYIYDTVEDPDAADGTIMRRWYATMVGAGEPIPWASIL